jgi:hypothetical protein
MAGTWELVGDNCTASSRAPPTIPILHPTACSINNRTTKHDRLQNPRNAGSGSSAPLPANLLIANDADLVRDDEVRETIMLIK